MNETICGYCGNDFKPKKKSQIFCTSVCHQASRKAKNLVRLCGNTECSNDFIVRVESDPKKYCSRSCAAKVNNTQVPKRKPEGICATCDSPVITRLKYCDSCDSVKTSSTLSTPRKPNRRIAPNLTCSHCSENFIPFRWNQKYCSTSCRISAANINTTTLCKSCNCSISKLSRTGYCVDCYTDFLRQSKIEAWLSGKWRGGTDLSLSKIIRPYLIKEANYTCTRPGCGFNTPHPVDGESVLEINHIDGNGENHDPSNLEVICPNCHALTPSYRGRNVGNGRNTYYLRVRR